MNIFEAAPHLQQGKAIAREEWDGLFSIVLDEQGDIVWNDGDAVDFDISDLLAIDWRVVS